MENTHDLNIFFEEKNTGLQDNNNREELFAGSLPYLKRGDSSHYLDQFFAKDEPEPQPPREEEAKREERGSQEEDDDFSLSERVKFNPSAFHNFQKHLTVCLRNCIEVKSEDKMVREGHRAAARLWKVFKNSSNSTKKILHFLLGERNEHKITEAGLKEVGLHRVYEEFGEKVMREARNFLADETLRQIKEGRLEEYIEGKKLKDKQQFKKYVEIFVEELEAGFLRKRLPRDKVIELQRS
jgi:hypothetical protein